MIGTEQDSSQRIELDARALEHNLRLFRSLVSPGTELLGVVKSNAYGHGLAEIAPLALREVEWLGVHSSAEAKRLRRNGVRCPILVMGFVPAVDLEGLDCDVHVVISSSEALVWVADYRRRSGVSLPVHLKVDIGTKRQGVLREQIPELCREAARQGVELVGVAGHFANIEDTIEHEFARYQLSLFREALERVEVECGGLPPFIHAACSAAALLFRETDFSFVRLGISMYGHWSSRETRLAMMLRDEETKIELHPVLTWKSLVGQIQFARTGESVGYGCTWRARRPIRLAVIPVGYADGYSRALGNRSHLLIHGTSAPVVGRVCMNILMADITDIPDVMIGDEVVLIGQQGGAEVAVEELASLSETINYEFLARLSPMIPRIVV